MLTGPLWDPGCSNQDTFNADKAFSAFHRLRSWDEMLFVPAPLLWQCNRGLIFVLSSITSLTKSLFPMKSPAIMLIHSFFGPGYCCFIQIFKHGRLRSVIFFSDPNGCRRIYLKFSVRLIPATKNFPETKIRKWHIKYSFEENRSCSALH